MCVLIFREPCIGEALLGLSSVVLSAVLTSLVFVSVCLFELVSSGTGVTSSVFCCSSSSFCIIPAIAVSTFSWSNLTGTGAASMMLVGATTGINCAWSSSLSMSSRTSLKLSNASIASISSSVLKGSAVFDVSGSGSEVSRFTMRSGKLFVSKVVSMPVKSGTVELLAVEVDGTADNVPDEGLRDLLSVSFASGNTVFFEWPPLLPTVHSLVCVLFASFSWNWLLAPPLNRLLMTDNRQVVVHFSVCVCLNEQVVLCRSFGYVIHLRYALFFPTLFVLYLCQLFVFIYALWYFLHDKWSSCCVTILT